MHILVLGCRVDDGEPMQLLSSRLRRARCLVLGRYAAREPVTVVVSGRGEAEPMRRWLCEHGVRPEDILVEPEATSTNENLERAHDLCLEAGRWAVVTNDFHARRTRVWAWHLGIPITVYSARTPASARLRNYVREVVAFPHSVLRVLWRRVVEACPALSPR